MMSAEEVQILSDFSRDDLAVLYASSERLAFGPRELVFEEGELDRSVFIVLEGELQSFSKGDGGIEHVFGVMGPGTVFGEIAFLDAEPRSASMRAVTESMALRLSREAFADLQAAHPDLAARFLADLSRVVCRRLRNMDRFVTTSRMWESEANEHVQSLSESGS